MARERERDGERDVVYVEREDSSLKPILFGALLGLAVGLLFAPQSGDETRRQLKRRLRSARALAEEKMGELKDRLGERRSKLVNGDDRDENDGANSDLVVGVHAQQVHAVDEHAQRDDT